MRIWIILVTALNSALTVVGLGVGIFAASAKPAFGAMYYAVAAVCLVCALTGFVNLAFLGGLAKQQEEKSRQRRQQRAEKKREKEAAAAPAPLPVEPVAVPDLEEAPADPQPDSPDA